MEYLIFKTDIKSKKRVKAVKPVFNSHPGIADWSVDTQDIDNVLRVQPTGNVREEDIIQLIKRQGFYCEVLPD